MDKDDNVIHTISVSGKNMKSPKDGLEKGSQIVMKAYLYLKKEEIKDYFSAKYMMLTWNTYYVEDGKLGPVRVGMSYTDLPKSEPCLYDKFEYKKELIENEMEGDYEVESCTFFNDGKEYFSAELEEGKVTSIVLDENSKDLRTIEDYHVGYDLLNLYQTWVRGSSGYPVVKDIRESLNWENYYEGEVFVTIGRYTFYVPSDKTYKEFPRTRHDFKAGATISRIVCK